MGLKFYFILYLTFQYERTNNEGVIETKYYTPAERAAHLGMHDLAEFLLNKRALQLERVRNQKSLLPKRTLQAHFQVARSRSLPSIFVTQSVM